MIICAYELRNGDVAQKPGPPSGGGAWHIVSKVTQSPECVRFTANGKRYALPRTRGMRVRR